MQHVMRDDQLSILTDASLFVLQQNMQVHIWVKRILKYFSSINCSQPKQMRITSSLQLERLLCRMLSSASFKPLSWTLLGGHRQCHGQKEYPRNSSEGSLEVQKKTCQTECSIIQRRQPMELGYWLTLIQSSAASQVGSTRAMTAL